MRRLFSLVLACVPGLLLCAAISDEARAQTYRLQNNDLSPPGFERCIGVLEAWGATFWPAIIVPCTDPRHTKWQAFGNGKIQSADLGTCLGVNDRSGADLWPLVLVNCTDPNYTVWVFRDRDEQIRNDQLKTCMGVREAWGAFFWPVVLVNCRDRVHTTWKRISTP